MRLFAWLGIFCACATAASQQDERAKATALIGCWKVEHGPFSVVGRTGVDPGQTLLLPSLIQFDTAPGKSVMHGRAGYATEATARLVDLAFTQLHAPTVAVCHDPTNVASEGVPRRLGFHCLGIVADAILPGREAADGSVRPVSRVWTLEALDRSSLESRIRRAHVPPHA